MGRKGRLLEATIIVLAIAVRVAAVLVLRNHEVGRSTYEHGEIAANLLAGRGFSMRFLGADGPTSQQAPVYPILVAAAYAIGGVGTPRGLAAPGVGTIRPGRTARLGRHAARAAGGARVSGHHGRRRIDRRRPPHAHLCRDARAGRRPGRHAARLDAGLGLSHRGQREAESCRDHRRVPRPAGAERPHSLAGDDRCGLGALAGLSGRSRRMATVRGLELADDGRRPAGRLALAGAQLSAPRRIRRRSRARSATPSGRATAP